MKGFLASFTEWGWLWLVLGLLLAGGGRGLWVIYVDGDE